MGKVAEAWESYERAVVPIGAPPVQREECRRAFYAGAWSLLQAVLEIDDTPEGEKVSASLLRECEAFGASMKAMGQPPERN